MRVAPPKAIGLFHVPEKYISPSGYPVFRVVAASSTTVYQAKLKLGETVLSGHVELTTHEFNQRDMLGALKFRVPFRVQALRCTWADWVGLRVLVLVKVHAFSVLPPPV
jgi:hypothetical protein